MKTDNQEKASEYAARIIVAITEEFKDDGYFEEYGNEFFHALANIAPTFLYNEMAQKEIDVLEFNHIANRLCFQFLKLEE